MHRQRWSARIDVRHYKKSRDPRGMLMNSCKRDESNYNAFEIYPIKHDRKARGRIWTRINPSNNPKYHAMLLAQLYPGGKTLRRKVERKRYVHANRLYKAAMKPKSCSQQAYDNAANPGNVSNMNQKCIRKAF